MADFKALILDAGVHKQIAATDYLNPGGGLLMAAGPVTLSGANTGRLQYVAGASQRFEVSVNGGAYVPLVTGAGTLADSYDHGTLAAHQTMTLTDAHGGGVLVDATNVGFTGANALSIAGTAGSSVVFPRIGGMTMVSVETIAVPAAISTWNAFDFQASTLTLAAGGVAPTSLSAAYFAAPTITAPAPGYVIPTAATVTIAGAPVAAGSATITNAVALHIPNGQLLLGDAGFVSVAPFVMNLPDGVVAVGVDTGGGVPLGPRIKFGSAADDDAYMSIGAYNGINNIATTNRILSIGGAAGVIGQFVPSSSNFLLGTIVDVATSRLRVQFDKTIAIPAAIDTWNGIDFMASTLTLAAGGVAPNELAAVRFAAPVITAGGGSAYVVPVAATVIIDGPPAAGAGGGATPTLTNTAALVVASGRVGIGTKAPQTILQVGDASAQVTARLLGGGAANRAPVLSLFSSGLAEGFIAQVSTDLAIGSTGGLANYNDATLLAGAAFVIDAANNNVNIGASVGVASSKLRVVASKSVVSAADAVWNGIDFTTSTLTLTGAVTPVTRVKFFNIAAPIITSANAITVGTAASLWIEGPPSAAGSTTITETVGMWIQAGGAVVEPTFRSTSIRATYFQDYTAAGPYFQFSPVSCTYNGRAVGAGTALSIVGGNGQTGPLLDWSAFGGPVVGALTVGGNLLLGTAVDAAATRLNVVASKTVASAAGAVWDGIKFAASTLTLTGSTQCNASINFLNIAAPTITDGDAVTVDLAATVYISGPPVAAGSVTITNTRALHVAAGTSVFDGEVVAGYTAGNGRFVATQAAAGSGNVTLGCYAGSPIKCGLSRNNAAAGAFAYYDGTVGDTVLDCVYAGAGIRFDIAGVQKVLITNDGYCQFSGRILGAQGADVTAANDITLGNGNYFDVTGATEVQRILGTGWTAGSIVTLQFDSNPNVKHGTAAGTGYYGFQLAGSADFASSAGDTLTLRFDGAWWREIGRTVI